MIGPVLSQIAGIAGKFIPATIVKIVFARRPLVLIGSHAVKFDPKHNTLSGVTPDLTDAFVAAACAGKRVNSPAATFANLYTVGASSPSLGHQPSGTTRI